MKYLEALAAIKQLTLLAIRSRAPSTHALGVWWEDEDPPAYYEGATCELGLVSSLDESNRQYESFDEQTGVISENHSSLALATVQLKFESLTTAQAPNALETQAYVRQYFQSLEGALTAKSLGLAVLPTIRTTTLRRRSVSDGRVVLVAILEVYFRFEYHYNDTPIATRGVINDVVIDPTIDLVEYGLAAYANFSADFLGVSVFIPELDDVGGGVYYRDFSGVFSGIDTFTPSFLAGAEFSGALFGVETFTPSFQAGLEFSGVLAGAGAFTPSFQAGLEFSGILAGTETFAPNLDDANSAFANFSGVLSGTETFTPSFQVGVQFSGVLSGTETFMPVLDNAASAFTDFSGVLSGTETFTPSFQVGVEFTGILSGTETFTPVFVAPQPQAFEAARGEFTASFTSGVAFPAWTTSGVTAVLYGADHPNLTSLGAGAVVSIAIPPIRGTGSDFTEIVGGTNSCTYQPADLDGKPTLVFSGVVNGGYGCSGTATAPNSFVHEGASPQTRPVTIAQRRSFGTASALGHGWSFGHSSLQDYLFHSGPQAANIWQAKRRQISTGGGLGPAAGASDLAVHTDLVTTNGGASATTEQFVDGTSTGAAVATATTGALHFSRAAWGYLWRNVNPPADNPCKVRRTLYANQQLNSTDRTMARRLVETYGRYAAAQTVAVGIMGASTSNGYNLTPGSHPGPLTGERYIEKITTASGIPSGALVSRSANGKSSWALLPDGTSNAAWFDAVDTAHNITSLLTGLAAVSVTHKLLVIHLQGGATGYDTAVGLGYTGTFDEYSTIDVANIRTMVDLAEAAGVKVIVNNSQPNDSPNPGPAGALSVYTARRLIARANSIAEFGTQYWDTWPLMADTSDNTAKALIDGTNATLQADAQHPTYWTHALMAVDLVNQIRLAHPQIGALVRGA